MAGIWPLIRLRNAQFMNNEVPGVSIPSRVIDRMAKARSKEEALDTGAEIASDLRRELEPHVQGFQISAPFGRIELALRVARIVEA